jgi:bifunctional non-homologous end joining protein LigD
VPTRTSATFIEPMLLLRKETLPADSSRWEYQLKLDGFRAIAFKTGSKVHLRSRNNKDFAGGYPDVVRALAKLPNDTVIDGEIVAVDDEGRPSFGLLQNANTATPIFYYVFDVMVLAGRNLMREPLSVRRALLETKVLPKLAEPVRHAIALDATLAQLIQSVKAQGFEGLVAKRIDGRYEPGQRSGAWQKMRVNRGQEFVIGGYTIGGSTFDALIFGYYEGDALIYAARTHAGFTPAVRAQLMKRFRTLETPTCPFANLPEAKSGRWGQGLTAAKMKDCRWLKPVLVGQFEFLEWSGENHLRHSKFVALREDKAAKDVRRE